MVSRTTWCPARCSIPSDVVSRTARYRAWQNCSGESYDVVTTGAVWRGVLCQDFGAEQWTAWFRQYSAFIVHYASLAQEAGADEYFVTHELATCEQYGPAALWGRLIDDVRAVFHGKVAAALNWGPFVTGQIVPTWTAKLDYIGVDCYFDLNVTFDRKDPRWYGGLSHGGVWSGTERLWYSRVLRVL